MRFGHAGKFSEGGEEKPEGQSLRTTVRGLNTDSVKVRDGVEGHEDFGTDHPIVEAMGFVRESTRKSGLTRKKASSPASKS